MQVMLIVQTGTFAARDFDTFFSVLYFEIQAKSESQVFPYTGTFPLRPFKCFAKYDGKAKGWTLCAERQVCFKKGGV